MTRTTRDENMSYLKGRLGDLRQELAEAAEHKRATQWFADRVELMETIRRQIAHIEAAAEKQ
jgi:hypothetical protein